MDNEAKEHTGIYGVRSEFGRSHGYIDCPFCGSQVKVYIWSYCGGGKKCSCGALLAGNRAIKKNKKANVTES